MMHLIQRLHVPRRPTPQLLLPSEAIPVRRAIDVGTSHVIRRAAQSIDFLEEVVAALLPAREMDCRLPMRLWRALLSQHFGCGKCGIR